MQKNNFSTELSKLATVPQAIDRYKISRLTLMKYAEQYDALVRFGRSVRIDIPKFDEGIEKSKKRRGKNENLNRNTIQR